MDEHQGSNDATSRLHMSLMWHCVCIMPRCRLERRMRHFVRRAFDQVHDLGPWLRRSQTQRRAVTWSNGTHGRPQVNLDFDCEAGMAETLRLACALQPVATALLANSPFRHGKPSGYLSWRAHAWARVEDPRCSF